MERPFDGTDLGHITPGGMPPSGAVPSSIKNSPQFTSNGLSYPSLDDPNLERTAAPHLGLARSMAGTGLLGLDGRLADTSSIVAGSGLRQPASAFSAPLGRVDRAHLPDVQGLGSPAPVDIARQAVNSSVDTLGGLGTAATQGALGLGRPHASPAARAAFDAAAAGAGLHSPAEDTRHNFPGMSVPADVASPHTMANGLGGLGAYVADNPAQSLAPDRPMPGGLLAAPEAPQQGLLAGLQYERPGLSNLLSPEPMAAALSPPTTVQNRPITQTIAPPTASTAPTTATTTIAAPEETSQNTFPAAPEQSFTERNPKLTKAVKDIATGGLLGGPVGAAIGGIGGLMAGRLGPGFDAAVPSGDRFSVGSGLEGIRGALGGPRGATANSLSNPGMSVTSLGTGQSLRRSDKYGWTEVVDPSGSVVGIQYDDPDNKGLLGKMNSRVGGLLGGKRGSSISPGASRAIGMGKGGLY